jgi:uncharacterized protein YggE
MRIFRSFVIISCTALAAVLLASFPARFVSAQDATPTASLDNRSITAGGTGTITITPDMATVTFGVDVSGSSLVQTQTDAATKMTGVINAIKSAGITEDNIQTIQYSVNVVNEYDDKGLPKGVSGYQVSNQVAVTTDDIEGLGKLIDDVVAAGANSVWGVSFLTSDSTNAQSQARALAITDAQSKAKELAKAAGVTLGDVVSITETSTTPGPVLKESAASDSFGGSTPIQSGSLQIQIIVIVTYAIS